MEGDEGQMAAGRGKHQSRKGGVVLISSDEGNGF